MPEAFDRRHYRSVITGDETTTIKAMLSCIAAGIPVLIEGLPGIGKSTITEQIGEQWGFYTDIVMLGEIVPEEMVGYPVEDRSREARGQNGLDEHGLPAVRIRTSPPEWVTDLLDAMNDPNKTYRGKLIFLDEMNQGGPSVQKTAAKLLRTKTIGRVNLGADTALVGAFNDTRTAIDGNVFGAPLANRCCFLYWPMDREVITKAFKRGGDFPKIQIPDFTEEIRETGRAWAKQEMMKIGTFLERSPDFMHLMPIDDEDAGRAWASPRSFENYAIVAGQAKAFGYHEDVISLLRRGMIGEPASVGLQNFLDTMDLQDPEELIANPELTRVPPRGRSDVAMLTSESLVICLERQLTAKRWKGAWQVLEKLDGEGIYLDAIAPALADMNKLLTASIMKECRPMLEASPLLRRFSELKNREGFVRDYELADDDLDAEIGLV